LFVENHAMLDKEAVFSAGHFLSIKLFGVNRYFNSKQDVTNASANYQNSNAANE